MRPKKRLVIPLIIVAAALLYLLWGPLFPWSPVKIGYTKIDASPATVYVGDMAEGDSVVYRIEEIIREEEAFHGLRFKDDFKIVVVPRTASMKRFCPWLGGSGYSVSFSVADLVYIGPAARRSSAGIEPHLKHELSHLLIGQNTTFEKARAIHEQGWFAEGIAEYFSGHGFMSKSDFIELSKREQMQFTSLHEVNPLDMSVREIRLRYSYYKFFIEYLVESYGLERLQRFLKLYIDDPMEHRKLFIEVYSKDLDEILEGFNSSLS